MRVILSTFAGRFLPFNGLFVSCATVFLGYWQRKAQAKSIPTVEAAQPSSMNLVTTAKRIGTQGG